MTAGMLSSSGAPALAGQACSATQRRYSATVTSCCMIATGRRMVTVRRGALTGLPSRSNSPGAQYRMVPGANSTIAGASTAPPLCPGATAHNEAATGPAAKAAATMADLMLSASNMAGLVIGDGPLSARRRLVSSP